MNGYQEADTSNRYEGVLSPFRTETSSARTLLVICLSALCWAFSFGLGAPLASVWLKTAGHGETIVGLNTGVYYLGIALAAGLVPWLMRRLGRGTLVAGMLASGVTVAWFPWGGSLAGYFVLRLLNGLAGAMSLIPLETLVNRNSPPEQRSRDFGFYAFSVAAGMALGTGIGMEMVASVPRTAFVLGGLLAVIAGAIVFRWLHWPALAEEARDDRVPLEFGRNLLNFGSAWSQGFLEGGMVALMPLYLLAIGMSEAGAGALLGGIMIGVIVFQVPVAWLADRWGRTQVLLGCYVVTAGMLAALYVGVNLLGLTVCLFLAGACSGAFYPLGLAIIGERIPTPALPRASAWYLAVNCLGSVTGPVLTGAAMDRFGRQSMFMVGESAVLGVVAVWAGLRFFEWLTSGRMRAETVEPIISEQRKAA